MIRTACPLDCFDSCSVVCDSNYPERLVAGNNIPYTNGVLCAHLYKHIHEAKRVTEPMVNGKKVSMSEALDAVAKALQENWLLWRGSGNMGVMQSVTNLLTQRAGGALTRGTLCDGAGDAGIVEGRGVNRLLPIEQIAKSEVVVVWGRNVTVTNSHLLPYIEDKELIVIDPVKTKIAKMANLYLQVKPRSDFYLATILARFIIMENAEDREWLEKFATDYEEYYEFTRTFRIKAILEHIGLSLSEIGDLLLMLQNKKVVFLVGAGVQRHEIGGSTLRAIDALAALLGLFGKEGCGVSYLSNSRLGFDDPFKVNVKTEQIAITPFSKYKTVLIQGGNPAESMPCTSRVVEALKSVENLIYFGLYENDTSNLANIIIPAKNFLEKDDLKLSYGHHYVQRMNKVYDSKIGISEYDFTQEILKRLNLKAIESLDYYIDYWLKQTIKKDNQMITPAYKEIPYSDGFGEKGGDKFEFIDDFYDDFEDIKALRRFRKQAGLHNDEFWLLTPKNSKTLNFQFDKPKDEISINPNLGIKDGEKVLVKSIWGELKLTARVSRDLREDTVLINCGVKGVNRLTPPISSQEGDMACYGDSKVKIEVFKE